MKRWSLLRLREKNCLPALVHEIEHLDGGLYVNKVEGRLYTIEEFEKEFGE